MNSQYFITTSVVPSTKAVYNGGIMSHILASVYHIPEIRQITEQTVALGIETLLSNHSRYQAVKSAVQQFIERSVDTEKISLGSIFSETSATIADRKIRDEFDCTVSAIMIAADLASLQQRDKYALGSLFEKTESGLKFIGCEEDLEGNDALVTNEDQAFLLQAMKDFSPGKTQDVYSYIKTEHWRLLGVGDKLSRDVYLAGDFIFDFDFLPIEE